MNTKYELPDEWQRDPLSTIVARLIGYIFLFGLSIATVAMLAIAAAGFIGWAGQWKYRRTPAAAKCATGKSRRQQWPPANLPPRLRGLQGTTARLSSRAMAGRLRMLNFGGCFRRAKNELRNWRIAGPLPPGDEATPTQHVRKVPHERK